MPPDRQQLINGIVWLMGNLVRHSGQHEVHFRREVERIETIIRVYKTTTGQVKPILVDETFSDDEL